jgi:hypothetical protein
VVGQLNSRCSAGVGPGWSAPHGASAMSLMRQYLYYTYRLYIIKRREIPPFCTRGHPRAPVGTRRHPSAPFQCLLAQRNAPPSAARRRAACRTRTTMLPRGSCAVPCQTKYSRLEMIEGPSAGHAFMQAEQDFLAQAIESLEVDSSATIYFEFSDPWGIRADFRQPFCWRVEPGSSRPGRRRCCWRRATASSCPGAQRAGPT